VKDYVEFEKPDRYFVKIDGKPEYRTDENLKLSNLISPFYRNPALSRYSTMVSSVSKGVASLRPIGDKNVYPMYGFYRN